MALISIRFPSKAPLFHRHVYGICGLQTLKTRTRTTCTAVGSHKRRFLSFVSPTTGDPADSTGSANANGVMLLFKHEADLRDLMLCSAGISSLSIQDPSFESLECNAPNWLFPTATRASTSSPTPSSATGGAGLSTGAKMAIGGVSGVLILLITVGIGYFCHVYKAFGRKKRENVPPRIGAKRHEQRVGGLTS